MRSLAILGAAAALFAAPSSLAAPAASSSLSSRAPGENLCHLSSPPQLCVPDPNITVEETARRAYQFYRAFVVDGDPRAMFALIDDVYIQHNPWYPSGPQAIWPLFCSGRSIGNEQSTRWCFDPSTNMSYAQYSTVDRWRWVDGCVHEHWDQGERMPPQENCYVLPTN
ncbi:hypothetical protein VTJ04DRAFT_3788 [Mycothermus thermophilus]|uniref:uncharacterized protein n=1 Tax=Humicola insolens TaxID=85995 RepID=UPI0037431888